MWLNKNRVIALALFWRFGYWFVALLAAFLFPRPWRLYWLCFIFLVFGIYTAFIAKKMCRHFICGMRNSERRPMKPEDPPTFKEEEKFQKEGIRLALFCILLGVIAPVLVAIWG